MMKSFFSLVGMLTVALWVFVGLLHLFLNLQGKNSPETYQKLRGIPVIGGYFPDVKPETDEEAARRAEDKIRMDIASSSSDMQMPRGWTVEQLEEFIRELKTQRERLVAEQETLDEERRAAEELLNELDEREATIAQHQEALDAKAKDLTLQRDLLDATKRSFEDDRDAKVDANLRRVAKVIENMKPQKAMALLVGGVLKIEDEDEVSERYRDAARLLAYLPAEASSAIMEQMTPVDYQRVVSVMKTLPLPTKG
jgi:flagellar motility protein MotE (MotC chaperone)